MNSQQITLLAESPLVTGLTLSVIESIELNELAQIEKYIIDHELVPKFNERIVKASMKPRVIKYRTDEIDKEIEINKQIEKSRQVKHREYPQTNFGSTKGVMKNEKYGRIAPLLHDPSVATIECLGAGKQVTVIRRGQKQITKIALTTEEINKILENISESAHIPLLQGVFRAIVDNLAVNAVISEMIGSRFVIKKQNVF